MQQVVELGIISIFCALAKILVNVFKYDLILTITSLEHKQHIGISTVFE